MIHHLQSIANKNGDGNRLLSYNAFIKEVLFAPEIGYYTKEHDRVGRGPKTDFYTAESLGPVFKKLVLASIKTILGKEDCEQFTFVEIGAEPKQGLFPDADHPFRSTKTIRPGQTIEIPKKSIVFANELLDAQPFHRLIYKSGQWEELGVKIEIDGVNLKLNEEILPKLSPEVEAISKELPEGLIEGYQLDLPLEAENLLETIVSQDWNGLLILFDYGFLWEDLIHNHPQGTARAYYNHKQHNDLLANPGDQDITCHICWDRLINILKRYQFDDIVLQRQESFFIHHAASVIQEIISTRQDGKFNYDKQTLQELIHPSHMGHKFQVLFGKK